MNPVDFLINCGVLVLAMFGAATLAYRMFYGEWPWQPDDEEDRE